MSSTCSTHPDRNSTGVCARCGMRTCDLCNVDVGGARYCSIVCFTEQALAAKGKRLKVKPADPLAGVVLKDDSVVLGADQARADESALILPEQQDDATSILDMAAAMKPPPPQLDESSVAPVEGRMKEPTSILGMHDLAVRKPDGTWLDEPPRTETPLPILLPGTRRSTIESTCVFHADTPAVVMCTLCGDPICTMCIADEDQGGRCAPGCRRDRAKSRKKRLLWVAAAAAALLIVGIAAFRPKKTAPAAAEVRTETPAEFEARSREAERVRLEADAREEARKRVEAREREEREKAEALAAEALRVKEAEAKVKAAEEARIAALASEALRAKEALAAEALRAKEAVAKAEADAKAALAKAEAEAKVKAEALAKAEAEARAKEEAARKAEEADRAAKAAAKAKAEAEAAAKAAAEAKAKEEAETAAKQLAVEAAFRKASGLIREATPVFCALADNAENAGKDVVPRIDSVVSKLNEAKTEYAWLAENGPSPDVVQRRVKILDELLSALQSYRARLSDGR